MEDKEYYRKALRDYACIVFLLRLYVQDSMYTLVDKIMRAHRSTEVITALTELLRDARSRHPKALPSAEEVAMFEDHVKEDISIAQVVAGFAYSYLPSGFFDKYCKKQESN